jgi:hypothetical protein
MKICPVGAEMFHAERPEEDNSSFSQFYDSA